MKLPPGVLSNGGMKPLLRGGVLLLCWFVLVLAFGNSAAHGQEGEPEGDFGPPPIEEQAYLIDFRLCFENLAQVTGRLRRDTLEGLESLLWSCMAEQWQCSVRQVSVPRHVTPAEWLRSATAQQFAEDFEQYDKLVLVGISYDVDRWVVELAEIDLLFLQKGPVFRTEVRDSAQLPRAILTQAHQAFTPHAAIESRQGRRVVIRLRASKLPLLVSEYRLVRVGSVFRPFRMRADPNTGEQVPDPVHWSFVVVTELHGTRAVCRLVAAVAGSLPAPATDPSEVQLLGVKSNGTASRLCVQSRETGLPVVALEAEVRSITQAQRVPIGTTGYDGCIRIPPSDSIVLVYLRQGRRPLAVLPVLPGSGPLPVAKIRTFEERLEIEGRIAALQDQVIDYVVARTVLIASLRKLTKEGNTGEQATRIVQQLRSLPTKEHFQKELEAIRQLAANLEGEGKRIPRSVQRMLDETNKLIDRYVDQNIIADAIAEYEAAAQNPPSG